MNDVIISIKSTQGLGDDTNSIEFTTLGQIAEKNGKIYLFYNEGENFESDNVKTTIKIDSENTVSLKRSGDVQSRLQIQKGKRINCFYSIPQGELVLGIYGENVINELSTSGGRLIMNYTVDVENDLISRNCVEIIVKEVNR